MNKLDTLKVKIFADGADLEDLKNFIHQRKKVFLRDKDLR